jgi:hypothetical protein
MTTDEINRILLLEAKLDGIEVMHCADLPPTDCSRELTDMLLFHRSYGLCRPCRKHLHLFIGWKEYEGK